MDAGEAWHFLITHCRDLEVCCGSARVKIIVSDDGWHTVTRHDGVEERADGTYTHDLLTYLAYVSRKADAPARLQRGWHREHPVARGVPVQPTLSGA